MRIEKFKGCGAKHQGRRRKAHLTLTVCDSERFRRACVIVGSFLCIELERRQSDRLRKTFRIGWKPAGSLPDLNRWVWTRKGWVGTHSNDSARRGCVGSAVWKTSTISGWPTVRKPCWNSTLTFTKTCSYASMKRSELATDSFSRHPKMVQLYRLSRNCTKIMQKKKQRKCRRMLAVQEVGG